VKHQMQEKLHAYRQLPAQLDSARSVLDERPKAILTWLQIWAHEHAPQYQQIMESQYLETQYSTDGEVPRDLSRTGLYV
jgi:hypothetical protein